MRQFAKLLMVWAVATIAVLAMTEGARAGEAANSEVRATIAGQIEALRQDDGVKAYSFASPGIQTMFPSVDAFMAMVKNGYAPVYRPQQFQFSDMQVVGDKFVQDVDITAGDGSAWTAQYVLARGADGNLKIEGCRLIKLPGVGA